jgi:hypothetical protein
MLPLQKCRQLLGSQISLTDSELESLCACLHQLAQVVIETPIQTQSPLQPNDNQHSKSNEE